MKSSFKTIGKILTLSLALLGPNLSGAQISEDKMREAYSYAYNAQGTLSQSDFRQIVKFELLSEDWNNAVLPLVADLRNENVTADQWVSRSRSRLDRVAVVLQQMTIAASQIQDAGTNRIASQIVAINSQIYECWGEISVAMSNQDEAAYQRAGAKARSLAQQKAIVAGPVLSRFREKLGDKVMDSSIQAALKEMARKLGI